MSIALTTVYDVLRTFSTLLEKWRYVKIYGRQIVQEIEFADAHVLPRTGQPH